MNLRPPTAWHVALDTKPLASLAQHAPLPNGFDVSGSYPSSSQTAADQDTESTLSTLLGRARDTYPHHRETRSSLAIGHLWQGDVDKAVSLVCDMLVHPAPAGFRSLLSLLLRFGHLGALAVDPDAPKRPSSSSRLIPSLLSAKETAVLRLISKGHNNKSIARELQIAPETVKCYAKKIFLKLSTHTRAEAVARAAAMGIL